MGVEIEYNTKNGKYHIWNTVVDEYEAKNLTRVEAKKRLANRDKKFLQRYNCFTCRPMDISYLPGRDIELICGGSNAESTQKCREEAAIGKEVVAIDKEMMRLYLQRDTESALDWAKKHNRR